MVVSRTEWKARTGVGKGNWVQRMRGRGLKVSVVAMERSAASESGGSSITKHMGNSNAVDL